MKKSDDIIDILEFGTKEEIEKVRCSECGGNISYISDGHTLRATCLKCGIVEGSTGSPEPNCAKYFGSEYTIV